MMARICDCFYSIFHLSKDLDSTLVIDWMAFSFLLLLNFLMILWLYTELYLLVCRKKRASFQRPLIDRHLYKILLKFGYIFKCLIICILYNWNTLMGKYKLNKNPGYAINHCDLKLIINTRTHCKRIKIKR
jgi:hypothetical protein